MNMWHTVVTLCWLLVPSFIAGALAGGIAARWLLARQAGHQQQPESLPPDPQLASHIDQAATAWAQANGRPEASGLMADKLHLLHRLGRRRGWLR